MHFRTAIALSLAISFAAAKPVPSPANNSVYATFYNDNACQDGAGQPVSTSNPGCLNESGRNSIYFQSAITDKSYYLIYSPSPDCPCQTYCNDIIGDETGNQLPKCISLDGTPAAQSYRFIEADFSQQKCPANNC